MATKLVRQAGMAFWGPRAAGETSRLRGVSWFRAWYLHILVGRISIPFSHYSTLLQGIRPCHRHPLSLHRKVRGLEIEEAGERAMGKGC